MASRLLVPVGRPHGSKRGLGFLSLVALAVALTLLALPVSPARGDGATSTVGQDQQVAEGSMVDDAQGIGINGFERRNKGTNKSAYGYVFPLNDPEAFAVLATESYVLVMVPQSVADEVGFKADDPAYTDAFMAMVCELDARASRGGALIADLDVPVTYAVGENAV